MPFFDAFKYLKSKAFAAKGALNVVKEAWLLGYRQGKMSARVEKPLRLLLMSQEPSEKWAILEQYQEVLLTDTAEFILDGLRENVKKQDKQTQEISDTCEYIDAHRDLLKLAREQGIAAAKAEIEAFPDAPENEQKGSIADTLTTWIALPSYREMRRFLEAHNELLNDEVIVGLEKVEELLQVELKNDSERTSVQEIIRFHVDVLRAMQSRSKTVVEIRNVYVDILGGLALDVPKWLEQEEEQLASLQLKEPSEKVVLECRQLLRKMIARTQRDKAIEPPVLAALYSLLGTTFMAVDEYDEEAISAYEQALQVYTRARYPQQHALTQSGLGNMYQLYAGGDQWDALQKAMTCFDIALQFFTRDKFPTQWAKLQQDIGSIYRQRVTGVKKDNVEKAIAYYNEALKVMTSSSFPLEWAQVQVNLGNVYFERIKGKRKANLEQAIRHFQSALAVVTYDTFPQQWAATNYSLANTYVERIEENLSNNIEQAIHHYMQSLSVYKQEFFPFQWGMCQFGLGTAYFKRIVGERRHNQEQAIAFCNAALRVLTRDTFPRAWAITQFNLGSIYFARIEGERRINLEQAIICLEQALLVFTRHSSPHEWARVNSSLGALYSERVEGIRHENQEFALRCCLTALEVFTYNTFPLEWARTQSNIANIYLNRLEWVRGNNIKDAITHYEAACKVLTRASFPGDWANIQYCLGNVYRLRSRWGKEDYLEQAIRYFEAALLAHTRDAFPQEWATIYYDLGNAYSERQDEREKHLTRAVLCYENALRVRTLEGFPLLHRITQLKRADAEMMRGNIEVAQEAYKAALDAEYLLLRLGTGVIGRDALLKEGRDIAVHQAYMFIQTGNILDAAIAIERHRARGLAETWAMNEASPERITNIGRRTRYEDARLQLLASQAALNKPLSQDLTENEHAHITVERAQQCQQAMVEFDTVLAEIQQFQDPPDFFSHLPDAATILRATEQGDEHHALVYLAATPWAGFAIAVVHPQIQQEVHSCFFSLELPLLTDTLLSDLFETLIGDETEYVIGGYNLAQQDSSYGWLLQQWEGKTFHERATALHILCKKHGKASTLDEAAQYMLQHPACKRLTQVPLATLYAEDESLLANTLNHYFLQLELQRCMDILAKVVMQPLSEWLHTYALTSVTLIPCGHLSALPFVNVPLSHGQFFAEAFFASVAPSARSLLRNTNAPSILRKGIYTLGNPQPTQQELLWGEAEALAIAKLANELGPERGYVKVQKEATRQWLTLALQQGCVVDVSCHGKFDVSNFLGSSLLLARGQTVSLGSVLSQEVNVKGLRLLILSGCQTSVLDLRGAVNEVQSYAVAMLQAGAEAVLASLWSVDDRATYLLMVRFVYEWLPTMKSEPPATALARAQRWLQTATHSKLALWYDSENIVSMVAAQQDTLSVGLLSATEKEPRSATVATRGRGIRLVLWHPQTGTSENTKQQDVEECPYAHPVYWAGFQIYGR